jgi:hypothetical protein
MRNIYELTKEELLNIVSVVYEASESWPKLSNVGKLSDSYQL